jgi:DHA3 family macrolide efflux protein-like MFS transporter
MTQPAGAVGRPSFRRALQNRPFFLLWLSQLVSQSGDLVFEVALLWLVLEVTGSVFAVGLVVAVTLLPGVLLGPFLGVYIDRWDRRRILIVTNVLEGVVVAALSGLILAHTIDLPLILGVVFILGTGSQVVRTAANATIPLVVARDDLGPANSLMTFSSSFNQVVGLAVGGVVVALFGVTLPIEYDALSFFAAALILVGVAAAFGQPSVADASKPPRFSEEFAEGIRFIRENRFLVELIVLAAFLNFFGNAVGALFAPYSKLVLHGGAATYGFLGATLAVGAIVGAAFVGSVNTRTSSGKYVLVGGAVIGAGIAALGFATSIPLALGTVFVLGVALSVTNIPISAVVQAKIPPRLLGRVGAAMGSLILIAGPVGAFFAGAFAQATSVETVFIVSGGSFLVAIAIGSVVMKEVRNVSY